MDGFTEVLRRLMSYLPGMNSAIKFGKIPFSKANIKSLFACSDFQDMGRINLDEWNYFQKMFLRGIEAFLEKSADANYQFIDSFDLSEILENKFGWHFSNR